VKSASAKANRSETFLKFLLGVQNRQRCVLEQYRCAGIWSNL